MLLVVLHDQLILKYLDLYIEVREPSLDWLFNNRWRPYLLKKWEVLAEEIRNTKDIKGIFVNQNEIRISQYADDTTLILDGSKNPWRFRHKYWNVSGQYLAWS